MTKPIEHPLPAGFALVVVGWKFPQHGGGYTLRTAPSNAPYYKEHPEEMVPVYELVLLTKA
jgi:hypothetical protein